MMAEESESGSNNIKKESDKNMTDAEAARELTRALVVSMNRRQTAESLMQRKIGSGPDVHRFFPQMRYLHKINGS